MARIGYAALAVLVAVSVAGCKQETPQEKAKQVDLKAWRRLHISGLADTARSVAVGAEMFTNSRGRPPASMDELNAARFAMPPGPLGAPVIKPGGTWRIVHEDATYLEVPFAAKAVDGPECQVVSEVAGYNGRFECVLASDGVAFRYRL